MLLNWVLVFFILALVAAFFGFSGVAAESAGIAKILFYIFLILLAVSLLMRILGRGNPPL